MLLLIYINVVRNFFYVVVFICKRIKYACIVEYTFYLVINNITSGTPGKSAEHFYKFQNSDSIDSVFSSYYFFVKTNFTKCYPSLELNQIEYYY